MPRQRVIGPPRPRRLLLKSIHCHDSSPVIPSSLHDPLLLCTRVPTLSRTTVRLKFVRVTSCRFGSYLHKESSDDLDLKSVRTRILESDSEAASTTESLSLDGELPGLFTPHDSMSRALVP